MLRRLFVSALLVAFVYGDALLPYPIAPQNDTIKHLRILGEYEITQKSFGGIAVSELSGGAYDAKRQRLYLISDEGRIFEIEALFSRSIERFRFLRSAVLRTPKGKRLLKHKRDSEGLAFDGAGRLWISFEGKRPAICEVSYRGEKFGHLKRCLKLTKKLAKSRYYQGKNKALEALAYHDEYGLITAAEKPLRGSAKGFHTLYTMGKKRWRFEAEENGGLVGMAVDHAGNLFTLERAIYGALSRFVITLKRIDLQGCAQNQACAFEVIARLDSDKGWRLDNFESIIAVGKDRFVLVSDDNDWPLQKTLLLYVEVKR